MAHNNPNLVPTVITDVNGKVTTVHRKAGKSATSTSVLPAPALGRAKVQKPSTASRVRALTAVLDDEPDRTLNKARSQKLLSSASPHELEVMDEALTSYTEASDHERLIIKSIILPLTDKDIRTDTIFELLALRAAFTSERSAENSPGRIVYWLESHLYGVRRSMNGDYDTATDFVDDLTKAQSTALLRFSFEMKVPSISGGFSPTYQERMGHRNSETALVYDSQELVDLIRENPDRVDELIEIALTHETNQASRIRAILEYEGHSSLNSGAL